MPQLDKNICKTPIVNILLNGEKFKTFPLRSGTRRGGPSSLLLFSIVLKVLTDVIKTRKGDEKYTDWEGMHEKLPLFTEYVIIYVENSKELM